VCVKCAFAVLWVVIPGHRVIISGVFFYYLHTFLTLSIILNNDRTSRRSHDHTPLTVLKTV
jgi:hypothetical protein